MNKAQKQLAVLANIETLTCKAAKCGITQVGEAKRLLGEAQENTIALLKSLINQNAELTYKVQMLEGASHD